MAADGRWWRGGVAAGYVSAWWDCVSSPPLLFSLPLFNPFFASAEALVIVTLAMAHAYLLIEFGPARHPGYLFGMLARGRVGVLESVVVEPTCM